MERFARCVLFLLLLLWMALPGGVAAQGANAPARSDAHEDCCPGYGVGADRTPVADRNDLKPEGELDKQARDFATGHGIAVSRVNGRFVFTLHAGKDITLFEVEASKKGLQAAETRLARLAQEKIDKLESDFNVAFSKEGEIVDKQWVKNDKGEWERGGDVKARAPHLNELYGIEAALYRAQPSHRAKGSSTGIKFYFLLDDLTKGERPLATWRSNRNGRPAIHYYPNATAGRPVLETDAPFDPSKPLGHAYSSIEALTLHEISHNHQHVVDWWNSVEATVAGDMGFVNVGVDEEGYTVWAIEVKRKDDSGNWQLYRKDAKSGMYYRCDRNGAKVAGEKELTRAEVRKLARVQPMTYYFPSPSETYAESVMILRLGGQYRASLLKESPALHALAKRLDQREIDMIYGMETYYQWQQFQDQWGRIFWMQVQRERSRYVRGADGKLVSNTSQSREALAKWEAKIGSK